MWKKKYIGKALNKTEHLFEEYNQTYDNESEPPALIIALFEKTVE